MEPTNWYLMEGRLDKGTPLEMVTNMMKRTIFYPGPDTIPSYVRWVVGNLAQRGFNQFGNYQVSDDPNEAAMQYLTDVGATTDGHFIGDDEARGFIANKNA